MDLDSCDGKRVRNTVGMIHHDDGQWKVYLVSPLRRLVDITQRQDKDWTWTMTRRGQTDDDHVKTETGHGHWYDDDREDDTRDRTDTTDKHDGLRDNRTRTHRQQGQRNTDCNGLKTRTPPGHLPLSSGPFVSPRPLHHDVD